jgi:hypothetical protein
MRVDVDLQEIELDSDHGPVAGLCLVCERCGHEVEVFGTASSSARRGAVTLREECPRGEDNFYIVEWDD